MSEIEKTYEQIISDMTSLSLNVAPKKDQKGEYR